MSRPTAAQRSHAQLISAISFALAALAVVGCGLETKPNPDKPGNVDSGITSGSGAGGNSGSNAGTSGKGGTSGSPAGAGGRDGGGGSTDAGSGGTSTGCGSGGTDAGSGTGGGAGASGCTSHLECDEFFPQCDPDGDCSECTSDDACEVRADTPRCQRAGGLKQGRCVQCLADLECTAPTPRCIGYACVECASNDECTDPARPQCTDGTCTPCTNDDACIDRPEGNRCVTDAADPATGTCVACTTNAHCENPTPECGPDHTCVPCTANAACTDRAGKTVCDLSTDPAFTGQCVQCTGTQYAGCGTDNVSGKAFLCSSLTRVCSQERLHNNGLCQPCSSDAACSLGQSCVKQIFKGNELTYMCLWSVGSGEGGAPTACAGVRPYVGRRDDVQSIDGEQVDVCGLRATTCENLSAFSSTSCTDDSGCGLANVDDGLCREIEPGTNRCTLPCTSSDDCRPGYACNTAAATPACDLQPDRCYVPPDCPVGKPVCDTNTNTCKSN